MNKEGLIEAIAYSTKLPKSTSKKALEAFLSATSKALAKKQRVGIVGFGAFSVVQRKARMVRNPQNGKPIQIKAKKAVKFRAGAMLSAKVN